jgi:hypothetical protein
MIDCAQRRVLAMSLVQPFGRQIEGSVQGHIQSLHLCYCLLQPRLQLSFDSRLVLTPNMFCNCDQYVMRQSSNLWAFIGSEGVRHQQGQRRKRCLPHLLRHRWQRAVRPCLCQSLLHESRPVVLPDTLCYETEDIATHAGQMWTLVCSKAMDEQHRQRRKGRATQALHQRGPRGA